MIQSLAFLSFVGLIGWAFAGYFVFLFYSSRRILSPTQRVGTGKKMKFSIIVPVHNEASLIARKIENLKRLRYPDFEVLLCDKSDDETSAIIEKATQDLPHFHLIRAKEKGRSFQNNEGLRLAGGDAVVLTDVDAMMPEDALEIFNDRFQDPSVGLVGACVEPEHPHVLDRLFWGSQNSMRLMESSSGHSPVVSGACYAFLRTIVPAVPEGVWAEDIYIPFSANTQGYRVVYDRAIAVREIRSPLYLGAFFKDKFRKGKDNIKEILRFFPRVGEMRGIWKVIFLTRVLQVVLFPFLAAIGLVLMFFQSREILLSSLAFLVFLALWRGGVWRGSDAPMRKMNILEAALISAVTGITLLGAWYFFLTQGSGDHYRRVAGVRNESPGH